MALSPSVVVVACVTLFAIGTPASRSHRHAEAMAELATQSNPEPTARLAPAAPSVATGGDVTLRSVHVFPDSDRVFEGGTAAEAMNSNCLACHSAGMVLNQPALSQTTWKDEVDKMRNTDKAPVAPDDVAAIVAYLTALSGKK